MDSDGFKAKIFLVLQGKGFIGFLDSDFGSSMEWILVFLLLVLGFQRNLDQGVSGYAIKGFGYSKRYDRILPLLTQLGASSYFFDYQLVAFLEPDFMTHFGNWFYFLFCFANFRGLLVGL